MSVLDMLQAYLQRVDMSPGEMLQQQMGRGEGPGLTLPSYLPDAVVNSILGSSSYAEGQQIPGPRNPLMEQEFAARMEPQRPDRFVQEMLGGRDFYRNSETPLPEGWWATGRQPGESPYPSPLNSLMRRAPLALY